MSTSDTGADVDAAADDAGFALVPTAQNIIDDISRRLTAICSERSTSRSALQPREPESLTPASATQVAVQPASETIYAVNSNGDLSAINVVNDEQLKLLTTATMQGAFKKPWTRLKPPQKVDRIKLFAVEWAARNISEAGAGLEATLHTSVETEIMRVFSAKQLRGADVDYDENSGRIKDIPRLAIESGKVVFRKMGVMRSIDPELAAGSNAANILPAGMSSGVGSATKARSSSKIQQQLKKLGRRG